MDARRWTSLGLCLAALMFAGSAFAQSGPTLPRIDPGLPTIPETGPDVSWMFVHIPGMASNSTLGQLTVTAQGDLLVWAVRREPLPVGLERAPGTSEVTPRRTDPGDPRAGGGGGTPGGVPSNSDPATGPTLYRTDAGDIANEPTAGGAPVTPVQYVTTSTLYQLSGTTWTKVLERPDEIGAFVFESVHGDLYANTNRVDGTMRVYRFHHGAWRMEGLPEGTVGPAGAFAGENVVFMRTGGAILRETGYHWNVAVACDGFAQGGGLVYLGRDQIMAPCPGHEHVFDGTRWVVNAESLPANIQSLWGGRDADGSLHLFAGGCTDCGGQMQIFDFNETQPEPLIGQFHTDLSEPPLPTAGVTGHANTVWGRQVHDVYVTGVAHGVGHLYHFDGARWLNVIPQDVLPATIGVSGHDTGELWVSLADGRLLHRPGFTLPSTEVVDPPVAPLPPFGWNSGVAAPAATTLVVRSGPAAPALLEFSLPEACEVSITVFDPAGRRVDAMRLGWLGAGTHQLSWDAGRLASGLYFCRLEAGAIRATGKVFVHR